MMPSTISEPPNPSTVSHAYGMADKLMLVVGMSADGARLRSPLGRTIHVAPAEMVERYSGFGWHAVPAGELQPRDVVVLADDSSALGSP